MKDNHKHKEELDVNGNPIDPNREYIGNKIKVPMLSPNASIYKSSAIIFFKSSPRKDRNAKYSKIKKRSNEV